MAQPTLSIIIPAYNEENRLPITLKQVVQFAQEQPYSVEIFVVENGSTDRTYELAQDFASVVPNLQVLRESRAGKGLAVQKGMLAAQGDYRFMCDADLSMPVAEISKFLPPALQVFDIAIGSREAPGAIRYNEPGYRHWGGRGINLLIRLLALPGLRDTQCGFKMFRGTVAEDLFRCQTLANWSFDIEVLFIARLRGYRIMELPIHWYFNPETKLSPIRDAVRMVLDIVTIHRNARRGAYDLRDQS
ncbi:MAG: glycosyltransferase family 2 protein [Anaerolineales bacterium]|nr:glycosyltransferase family 2 protein [Anaerolineales bacterium]